MALNNFRRVDMKINKANYYIDTQMAKEGDYNGRELVVQITDDGEIKNQTGVSLNLGWRHDGVGNAGLDPFSVVDISKGIFKIAYPKEMLNAGLVTAVIQVLENGRITLTRNFKITVEKNPIDEDTIVSENSFTVLQEALITVEQYNGRITNLENGKADKKTTDEISNKIIDLDQRNNGISLNPLYPPVPLNAAKADANYYNPANQKYYQDANFTTMATDNRPVFQSLVNMLKDKGGTIEAPSGNYAFRSQINWESKVSLVGANKISTAFFTEGEIFNFIAGLKGASNGTDAENPEVWFEGCTFKDFTVDNKGLTHTSPNVGGKGLFILYMKKALFQDLIFLNTIGTALGCDFLVDTVIDRIFTYNAGRNAGEAGYGGNSGIGIGTCSLTEEPIVVSNSFVYNSGNYGIFVETQKNPKGYKSKHAKVVNCHADGNRLGFGNKGSGGVQWIGCSSYRNRLHGFHLTQYSYGDQILNCISEENGGDGIRIEDVYMGDLDISNVRVNRNGQAGIRQKNNKSTGFKNARFSHITAHENGGYGLGIEGNTKNIKLIDIDTVNNGQNPPTSSHQRGILIQGVNDVITIANNTIYDDQSTKTQTVGIEISAETTNYILDGNNVSTYNSSSGYQIKSTSGTIGTNAGLLKENYGYGTIPNGEIVLEVAHGLGSVPKFVDVNLYQNAGTEYTPIWIDRANGNSIRVRREGTVGDLTFYWQAKKYDSNN